MEYTFYCIIISECKKNREMNRHCLNKYGVTYKQDNIVCQQL